MQSAGLTARVGYLKIILRTFVRSKNQWAVLVELYPEV